MRQNEKERGSGRKRVRAMEIKKQMYKEYEKIGR